MRNFLSSVWQVVQSVGRLTVNEDGVGSSPTLPAILLIVALSFSGVLAVHVHAANQPIDASWVRTYYDGYNEVYFGGKLTSNVKFDFVTNLKVDGKPADGATVCYADDRIHCSVRIDAKFSNDVDMTCIVLLHEMIHIEFWFTGMDDHPVHGPAFNAEKHRLMYAGAYDALL